MEKTDNNINTIFINLVLSSILFLTTYFLTVSNLEGAYNRDFLYHSEIAKNFSIEKIGQEVMNGNTYFMWHALVSLLYNHGKVSLTSAAAVVTALANVLTLNFILEYMNQKVPTMDIYFQTYLGGGILFVGPLFFPWINPSYYLGTWTPNAWHNPTNNMVRPFAVAAVILILDIIEAEEKKLYRYIILAVVLAFSVIAKPSFLQGIAPAMALYVIVEIVHTKKINWKKWLSLASTFLPAVCIIFFQLWLTFYSGNTPSEGIGIEYLRVLNRYTNNAYISLLACTLFPIFVMVVAMIMQRKNFLGNSRIIFAMCYLTVSWLEMAFLYEKGNRERHANFAWGYMIAVLIVWVLCVAEFIHIMHSDIKYKSVVINLGLILFTVHLLMGSWYIISMLRGAPY